MSIHNTPSSDEISLLDLVVIFVKNWEVLLAFFLLTILATLPFVVLRPASYTYTSVYAIAEFLDEEDKLMGLEAPKTELAKLDLIFSQPSAMSVSREVLSLLMVLGIVLGLAFAIIGVFMGHFVMLIRQSLTYDLSPVRDRRITKFIRDKPRATVSGSLE